MEGTFHYMLMAEQAMVQKHILRTLKEHGADHGAARRSWNISWNTTGQSRRKSQWDATWKLRLSRRS